MCCLAQLLVSAPASPKGGTKGVLVQLLMPRGRKKKREIMISIASVVSPSSMVPSRRGSLLELLACFLYWSCQCCSAGMASVAVLECCSAGVASIAVLEWPVL